jgi:hypothetical protein
MLEFVLSCLNAISSQHPNAQDIWEACNGLKLGMQQASVDNTKSVLQWLETWSSCQLNLPIPT